MKKKQKYLIVFGIILLIGFILFKINVLPTGCKKVNQTYVVGEEHCCNGLDFAPTSDLNVNICLPKLPQDMMY